MKNMNVAHLYALITITGILASPLQANEPRFDVNDVSFLWPPPRSTADVDALLAAADTLADGTTPVWPRSSFDAVIAQAQQVVIEDSAGRTIGIGFGAELQTPFAIPSTWKVVAIRVDPSAPGTEPKVTEVFGSVPQMRLILQPVTTSSTGKVTVHDVTAHLVFNFVSRFEAPAAPGLPPRAVPDKEAFGEVVDRLRDLKQFLHDKGVETKGKLGVHPGLKQGVAGFANRLKDFVKMSLRQERLAAVAFMGLDRPEPWIFFAMSHKDGVMAMSRHPTLGGKAVQMLTFRGGTHVMPTPSTSNIDRQQGVSTASLFAIGAENRLTQPVFQGKAKPKIQDIPDIIANPFRSHFFNTDCVSCHSESSRRKELRIANPDESFKFVTPPGISGIDESLLPQNIWNVRNFGWFQRGNIFPTVTMRTANEAAESADFINKTYLGQAQSNEE